MAALTRLERLLDAIAGNGSAPEYPNWPITSDEVYLYAILNGTSDVPKPLTEKQKYLYYRATGSGELPAYPLTDELAYWAYFARQEGELPPARAHLLNYIKSAAREGYDPVFANNTWEQIVDACQKNAVPATWMVGDIKPLDLGAEGIVNMQIAGLNVDDLANGSGKAHISFISKELLATSHSMNPRIAPSSAPYDEGTGSIGGWEKSEMRAYLKNTVKPLIPSAVCSAIVEVTKTHTAYNTAGSSFTQTTQDDVWLPSWDEISGSSVMYGALFPNKASRIKNKVGKSSASYWWTRKAVSDSGFYYISSSGSYGPVDASYPYAVALGFCL